MNEFIAKKSLGQHWLEDRASLEAMCDAAEVRAGDIVLEVGPGKGSLTTSLLKRGSSVVAVELDDRLAERLKQEFSGQAFTLNLLSILEFDFSSLEPDYKLVANIPYYLTNHLLRQLSETPNQPIIAAILLQKEVAQRIAAAPGEMSILSVSVQLYYKVELGRVVPAMLFDPPPKVDSRILILKRREKPLFPGIDTKELFRIVKAGFSAKRKKLRSSLSAGLGIRKQEAEKILHSAGIDPNLRAQNLSLEDWHQLSQQLK